MTAILRLSQASSEHKKQRERRQGYGYHRLIIEAVSGGLSVKPRSSCDYRLRLTLSGES